MLRILFLGDVVGEPGRKAVRERLPAIKEERAIDFVIVNGENAAGGRGITPRLCIDLMRAGAAVVTTGDHAWDQADIIGHFECEPRLLRPLNYPPGTPGNGSIVLETKKGKVAVMQLQGRAFMQPPLENPFLRGEAEALRIRNEEDCPIIFVDFHAEATSEKIAMGRFLDGKVSAVVGTHTHVQTADEQIFPGGTAFLCDAGMCGPLDSVIGSGIEGVIHKFTTGRPSRFGIGTGPVGLRGVLVDVDPASGNAIAVERFAENCQ